MTNKISKVREALEEIQNEVYHNEGEGIYDGAILSTDGLHVIISKESVDTVTAILTTLSSIDEERLGYVLDKPNPKPQKDWDVIIHAAATLHGLVRGE